jgi:hypothetical protein
MYDPPWVQNLYPEDISEIHNFGRGIPALHHHGFSFSYIHVVSEEIFLKIGLFSLFARHQQPQGTEVLQFTIYVPHVLNMHQTKFEKNRNSGYQEQVKNVQLFTCLITDHFGAILYLPCKACILTKY